MSLASNRRQISLPFVDACKLNEDQKCKLLVYQARRVAIHPWEVESLIDICRRKGWMDKGLAVLYEYAGCIDEIQSQLINRAETFERIIKQLDVSLGRSIASDFNLRTLCLDISDYAVASVKSLVALCSWRKLQWSPPPIFLDQTGVSVTAQQIMRQESMQILDCFKKVKFNIFRCVPVEVLALILLPAMDYQEFLGLHRHFQRSSHDHSDDQSTLHLRSELKRFGEVRIDLSDSSLLHSYNQIRDLIALEDRIESCWQVIHSVLSISGAGNPYDLFPTLRLPYRGVKAPTQDLNWFNDVISTYSSVRTLLASKVESGALDPLSYMDNLPANADLSFANLAEKHARVGSEQDSRRYHADRHRSPNQLSCTTAATTSIASSLGSDHEGPRKFERKSVTGAPEGKSQVGAGAEAAGLHHRMPLSPEVKHGRNTKEEDHSILPSNEEASVAGFHADSHGAVVVLPSEMAAVDTDREGEVDVANQIVSHGSDANDAAAGPVDGASSSVGEWKIKVVESPLESAAAVTSQRDQPGMCASSTEQRAADDRAGQPDAAPPTQPARGEAAAASASASVPPSSAIALPTSEILKVASKVVVAVPVEAEVKQQDKTDSSHDLPRSDWSSISTPLLNLTHASPASHPVSVPCSMLPAGPPNPPAEVEGEAEADAEPSLSSPIADGSTAALDAKESGHSPAVCIIVGGGAASPSSTPGGRSEPLINAAASTTGRNSPSCLDTAHAGMQTIADLGVETEDPEPSLIAREDSPSPTMRSIGVGTPPLEALQSLQPSRETTERLHSSFRETGSPVVGGGKLLRKRSVTISVFKPAPVESAPASAALPRRVTVTGSEVAARAVAAAQARQQAQAQTQAQMQTQAQTHKARVGTGRTEVTMSDAETHTSGRPSQMPRTMSYDSGDSSSFQDIFGDDEYGDDGGSGVQGGGDHDEEETRRDGMYAQGVLHTVSEEFPPSQSYAHAQLSPTGKGARSRVMSADAYDRSSKFSKEVRRRMSNPHPPLQAAADTADTADTVPMLESEALWHSRVVTDRPFESSDGQRSNVVDVHGNSTAKMLGVMSVLSRPRTRGESKAEGQIVQIALRSVALTEGTVDRLAAKKIETWWLLVAPRKKLMTRKLARDVTGVVINMLIDRAVKMGTMRQRRRRALLRQGSALKIQRHYRHWCATTLAEEKRQEIEDRRKAALASIDKMCRSVWSGIRIYRYIRYCNRRRSSLRSRVRTFADLPTVLGKYMQLIALVKRIGLHQQLTQAFNMDSLNSMGNFRRMQMYKERNKAATMVQKHYRRYAEARRYQLNLYMRLMFSKVQLFLVRSLYRIRRRKQVRLNLAATKIQRYLRGIIVRKKIFDVVRAGLKLNSLWRKHVAYKNLKHQLRRVERPHTIVIRGLSNIPKKSVNTDHLRVKVSVWWNPLLHIVSAKDFSVIINSKQPQYIYNGSNHHLTEEVVTDENGPKVASFSKLSTSLFKSRNPSGGFSNGSTGSPSSRLNGASFAVDKTKAAASPSRALAKYSVLPPISDSSKTAQAASISTGERGSAEPLGALQEGNSPPKDPCDLSFVQNKMLSPEGQAARSLLSRRLGKSFKLADALLQDIDTDTDADVDAQDCVTKLTNAGADVDGAASRDRDRDSVTLSGDEHPDVAARRISAAMNMLLDADAVNPSRMCVRADSTDIEEEAEEAPAPALGLGSSGAKSGYDKSFKLVRNTLMFLGTTMTAVKHRKASAALKQQQQQQRQPTFACSFDDETIKIPSCHGNSVFKFEILEGERKIGNTLFYLSKEGEMMYWGGEYQREVKFNHQKRAIQFNAHIISTPQDIRMARKDVAADTTRPIIEFRVIAGAPLRSRCQWGRILVRGSGPLKRLLQSKGVMTSLLSSVFDKWHRYFISLDEFGLFFFEAKYSTVPFYSVPVSDLRAVSTEMGGAEGTRTRTMMEDIRNVVLTTHSGDEIAMKFQDAPSRVAWEEVLQNAIDIEHNARSVSTTGGGGGGSIRNRVSTMANRILQRSSSSVALMSTAGDAGWGGGSGSLPSSPVGKGRADDLRFGMFPEHPAAATGTAGTAGATSQLGSFSRSPRKLSPLRR